MFNFFGKPPPTLKEKSREWTSNLKKQGRTIGREIRKIEREEAKMKIEIKREAKRAQASGNHTALKTLAKSMVRSQGAKNRMYEQQTRLASTVRTIQANIATNTVMKTMEKSTEVMKAMGQLMNLPQMNQVARDMAREMEKMGIIDEMVEESFDMIDDDDIEEIADQEVDKLLYEITKGQIGALPNAPIRPGVEKDEKEQELDDDKEMEEMKARLAGLAE